MEKKIKCVVFDLDGTVWNGVALEEDVEVIQNVKEVIEELDNRGIIMSISSKGELELYWKQLQKFELAQYFIAPQISLAEKEDSILTIAKVLDISLDEIAFVDNEEYELDKIKVLLPEVLCINSNNIESLLINKRTIYETNTQESRGRREFIKSELKFKEELEKSKNKTDFFMSINMCATVRIAQKSDVERVFELLYRTHRMNTANAEYTQQEVESLVEFRKILVLEYSDVYYSHGIMGVISFQEETEKFLINVVSISCRLVSRNVGTYAIAYITERFLCKKKYVEINISTNKSNIILKTILLSLGYCVKDESTLKVTRESFMRKIPKYIQIGGM